MLDTIFIGKNDHWQNTELENCFSWFFTFNVVNFMNGWKVHSKCSYWSKNIKERFYFCIKLIQLKLSWLLTVKKEETKTTIDIQVKVSILNKFEFWFFVNSGMCRVEELTISLNIKTNVYYNNYET